MKKQLVGNDKLIGRPTRLNVAELEPNEKGYASIVFWGDVHFGYPTCDMQRAIDMLNYCIKNRIYVIGMGDMLECGLTTSIGDSVYHQKLNPQLQMEQMLEYLNPLAKSGLFLGMHSGNHEDRITKVTSLNITKNMCRELGVRHLGSAIHHLFKVGDVNYTGYSMHGSGGASLLHTKLANAMKVSYFQWTDFIAMGHMHAKAAEPREVQRINIRNRTVEQIKQWVVLTGSYINYDGSYAQGHGMPPATLGSPKLKFSSDRRDIHGSM